MSGADERGLDKLLDSVREVAGESPKVSLGEILETTGGRSIGALLVLAGLLVLSPVIGAAAKSREHGGRDCGDPDRCGNAADGGCPLQCKPGRCRTHYLRPGPPLPRRIACARRLRHHRGDGGTDRLSALNKARAQIGIHALAPSIEPYSLVSHLWGRCICAPRSKVR